MLRWRREKREKKEAGCKFIASLSIETKKLCETSESCINDGEINHYTSRLRDKLQKFSQPAAG